MLIEIPGDPLKDSSQNCPSCLEPMEPRLAVWWCEQCQVALSPGAPPGDAEDSRSPQ